MRSSTSSEWPRRRGPMEDSTPTSTASGVARPSQNTSYFLADEASMEAAAAAAPIASQNMGRTPRPLKSSSYGVQSLDDSLIRNEAPDASNAESQPYNTSLGSGSAGSGRSGDENVPVEDASSPRADNDKTADRAPEATDPATSPAPSPPPSPTHSLSPSASPAPASVGRMSLAPCSAEPSGPCSPRSTSTKSFHPSDTDSLADDAVSQAIASSGEEDDISLSSRGGGTVAPQLVMPSIQMPSRRPFTERGKSMGRLKVLIAGQPGAGKTSLIRSIVQTCEDIVHVDPLVAPSPSLPQRPARRQSRPSRGSGYSVTSEVTEIYASTRSYPAWWSDLDESKVLRRRKSLGETVLERNLCFVDTPGCLSGRDFRRSAQPVLNYVEHQLERTASAVTMGDGDIMAMLNGTGGSQVDVVLYLFARRPRPVDLEYLSRLAPLTNIVPLIAQADRLEAETVATLKTAIIRDLHHGGVRPFLFAPPPASASTSDVRPPLAVSSATANDMDAMDASLLMSSDYMQPLHASELASLVERMFERDSVAWLRHCAARKFVHWLRGSKPTGSLRLSSARSPGSVASSASAGPDEASCSPSSPASASASLGSASGSPSPVLANTSYALARVADHTQREDRLAQVRLAQWASDLQRSLEHERQRYRTLARDERARWLTEKIGDCVRDGSLAPALLEQRLSLARAKGSGTVVTTAPGNGRPRRVAIDGQDPLGLLRWMERLTARAWLVVQVLGGCGIIGGVALWIAHHRHPSGDGSWDWEWLGFGRAD